MAPVASRQIGTSRKTPQRLSMRGRAGGDTLGDLALVIASFRASRLRYRLGRCSSFGSLGSEGTLPLELPWIVVVEGFTSAGLDYSGVTDALNGRRSRKNVTVSEP